jgi:hypothetical protein
LNHGKTEDTESTEIDSFFQQFPDFCDSVNEKMPERLKEVSVIKPAPIDNHPNSLIFISSP